MAQISKIFYVITQSELGGAQRYVFDLARSLSSEEYVVTVCAGSGGSLLTKFDGTRIASVTLKYMTRAIDPIKDLFAYWELKRLFKKHQPDIVHLNSSKAGVVGAIAAKHAGVKKVIYTVHGFVFNEPMPVWKKYFYILAEKFSARYKDKLICVSEFDRQIGIKRKIAKEEKFVTIHNGIENLEFYGKEEARDKLNLPQDKIIVGTIANFYPTKGLSYLIKAAKTITEKNNNIIFKIIGFGELEKELKKQTKMLNLTNKVDLENSIFQEARLSGYKYLKAFDVYCLPSIKEGFPYALLEAMTAGLPIVSTKVGGIPEMIDEASGILVEPKNPQALAEAIIKLVGNKNVADACAHQAQEDVKNKFSLDKMVEKTIAVYKAINIK